MSPSAPVASDWMAPVLGQVRASNGCCSGARAIAVPESARHAARCTWPSRTRAPEDRATVPPAEPSWLVRSPCPWLLAAVLLRRQRAPRAQQHQRGEAGGDGEEGADRGGDLQGVGEGVAGGDQEPGPLRAREAVGRGDGAAQGLAGGLAGFARDTVEGPGGRQPPSIERRPDAAEDGD